MTDFRPGDRVLVTADCLPAGGMLGTVDSEDQRTLVLDTKCSGNHPPGFNSTGFRTVHLLSSAHQNLSVSLHYRPTPPRPDLHTFHRRNGSHVDVFRAKPSSEGLYPSSSIARTPEDAENFARLYTSIAAVLAWEKEHGNGVTG